MSSVPVVVRRPVDQQFLVGDRGGRLVTVVPLVSGGGRQDIPEHLVEPAARPIRHFHPTILHR